MKTGFWFMQGLPWASENAFILEEVLPLELIYPIYDDLRCLLSILIYILCTRCLHHFFSVGSSVVTYLCLEAAYSSRKKALKADVLIFPFSYFLLAKLWVSIIEMNILAGDVCRMTANRQA